MDGAVFSMDKIDLPAEFVPDGPGFGCAWIFCRFWQLDFFQLGKKNTPHSSPVLAIGKMVVPQVVQSMKILRSVSKSIAAKKDGHLSYSMPYEACAVHAKVLALCCGGGWRDFLKIVDSIGKTQLTRERLGMIFVNEKDWKSLGVKHVVGSLSENAFLAVRTHVVIETWEECAHLQFNNLRGKLLEVDPFLWPGRICLIRWESVAKPESRARLLWFRMFTVVTVLNQAEHCRIAQNTWHASSHVPWKSEASRQQGDMPIPNLAMPGATGCGGLATKDNGFASHPPEIAQYHRQSPFGAWPCQLWSRPHEILLWHSDLLNLTQTATKFTVLSLLRRRNHRCWCCHHWCLFNLFVLARFCLQERPIQKTL